MKTSQLYNTQNGYRKRLFLLLQPGNSKICKYLYIILREPTCSFEKNPIFHFTLAYPVSVFVFSPTFCTNILSNQSKCNADSKITDCCLCVATAAIKMQSLKFPHCKKRCVRKRLSSFKTLYSTINMINCA